jgi:hypothetical protein
LKERERERERGDKTKQNTSWNCNRAMRFSRKEGRNGWIKINYSVCTAIAFFILEWNSY